MCTEQGAAALHLEEDDADEVAQVYHDEGVVRELQHVARLGEGEGQGLALVHRQLLVLFEEALQEDDGGEEDDAEPDEQAPDEVGRTVTATVRGEVGFW